MDLIPDHPDTITLVDHLGVLVGSTPLLDHPTLIAVDGVDGSGKTTFAADWPTVTRGKDERHTSYTWMTF